jgi:hypothetical protein
MRRTLIIIALAIIALIAGVGTWGLTLPREHRAASRITLTTPRDSVYSVMRDFGSHPTWWPSMTKVEAVPSTDGWERWTETVEGFAVTFKVTEEEPPLRFRTEIEGGPDAIFGGTWSYEVEIGPGSASVVTVREDGWVSNPFYRAMMKVSGPHAGMDSFLTALGTRFGQQVTPVHVE